MRFLIMKANASLVVFVRTALVAIVCVALARGLQAGDHPGKVWNFDADAVGKIASGFRTEVGHWEVARDQGNHVLCQKARNEDATFNVAFVEGAHYKDVDISVRLKAVAGEIDRGGGVVWRAQDRHNYYVCRYNPLEDNFRLYKVEAGKRKMLRGAKTTGDDTWHTLRVTMAGAKITCYLDGKKLLEAEDSTFQEPGMIGLWSKADAQTYFDEMTVND
ncbi:MAG: family 16 glycoside hydrolase [Isosphaeraceae bacterium]